jgi:hypothetical protein
MSDSDLKSARFSGPILTQGAPDFECATKRFSALAERTPRYIVFPRSARDVSIALQYSQQ